MTDTLNLNSADCLRTVSDIGVNHVHNICTGVVTDVPWGSLDWAAIIIASIFIFASVAVIVSVELTIARDR